MTLTAYQLWEGGSESPALHFTVSEEQSLFALVKAKHTAGPNEQSFPGSSQSNASGVVSPHLHPDEGPGGAGGTGQPPGTALSLGFRKPQLTKTRSISSQASSPGTFFEDFYG